MKNINNIKTLKPHISLNVRDIEKSVAFYTKMFGIDPVKYIHGKGDGIPAAYRPRAYAKFDVTNPQLNFTLNETDQRDGGISHLGIQAASTEDVIATRTRWKSEGLEVRDEMGVDCCYALQDKAWVCDPDGNQWEVFVVLKNTEMDADCCARDVIEQKNELISARCCHNDEHQNNISHLKTSCC